MILDVLSPLTTLILALKCLLFSMAFVAFYRLFRTKASGDLPPSPPVGIFGNFAHPTILFSEFPWRKYSELSKSLGNVIYLSIFGQSVIVLNSVDDARNLLDKKGAIYSERPPAILMGELYGWKDMMSFLPYSNRFREQRRMMQQTFNSQAVKIFREPQKRRVVFLLRDLIQDGNTWTTSTRRFVSANVMKATYGHEMNSDDDKFVQRAVAAVRAMSSNAAAGSDIVDILPFLRHIPAWFPGAGYQRRASSGKKLHKELVELPYQDVKAQMESDALKLGLLPRLLEEYEAMGRKKQGYELNMKSVAAVTYAASLNTTGIASDTFLLMMTLYPEVAKAAQAEIDRVVGTTRLPDLGDRRDLPYIDCIMKEVLRIHPPVPLVIPHSTSEEDTYLGMRIPSRSIILPNVWHMMRDTKYFERPDEFHPERFLAKVKSYNSSEQALNGLYPDDPSSIIFGFGRRICPGRYFADGMLWLIIASTLAVFDFRRHIDPVTGKEDIPEFECNSGQTSGILPFKYLLIPRSDAQANLVKRLASEAQ